MSLTREVCADCVENQAKLRFSSKPAETESRKRTKKRTTEVKRLVLLVRDKRRYVPKIHHLRHFSLCSLTLNSQTRLRLVGVPILKHKKIRKLRNRIFHHEPIYKQYKTLIDRYNEIIEILSYLPQDSLKIIEQTCRFKDIYKQILEKEK